MVEFAKGDTPVGDFLDNHFQGALKMPSFSYFLKSALNSGQRLRTSKTTDIGKLFVPRKVQAKETATLANKKETNNVN